MDSDNRSAREDIGSQEYVTLVLESLSEEGVDLVRANLSKLGSQSLIVQAMAAVSDGTRATDVPLTRFVISGDMTASVNLREDRSGQAFSRNRGSGLVVGKTMPPNRDGIVDILVPAELLLREPSGELQETVLHIAAHEAVHATMFHRGTDLLRPHLRAKYGDALRQFVAMAGYQAEEHLAEYLARSYKNTSIRPSAQQVRDAFEAWNHTLASELPQVVKDADYFEKCMLITLNALHVFWKVLSYLAAELREGDSFKEVPQDIAALDGWKTEVAPWWEDYVELLAQIPMNPELETAIIDPIIEQIAELLQGWALGIGVDHHDTEQGPWFQMTRGA